jgi:hypothetical protein
MIWLTWRQQRLEALIGVAVLAALITLLVITGRNIEAVYQHSQLAACTLGPGQLRSCGDSVLGFNSRFAGLVGLTNWFNMVPLLIGVLVAAPIVLEFEQGTHRLAWTQTITRRRWLTTRLTLALVTAVTAALAVTLLMTWWRGPFDHLNGRLGTNAFDFEGTVPIAYTVFAASVILAVGTILRRTLPAIAVALVSFLVLRLGIEGWVRYQHYMPPLHKTWSPGTPSPLGETSGWISESGLTMPASLRAGGPHALAQACGITNTSPSQIASSSTCLAHHGVYQYAIYQPANRFWAFQSIETAIYLTLALALLVTTIWWANHRLT